MKVGPSFSKVNSPQLFAKSQNITVQTAGLKSILQYGGSPEAGTTLGL